VGEIDFSVLEHKDGNGGCLVPGADEVTASKGLLVYFNVDGRIREAVTKTQELGGKVIDDVTSLAAR
jgi:predicted enzyme related to lactoylglutathione lyase